MQRPKPELLLRCPTTGQACTRGLPVDDRTYAIKRWYGGSTKAIVCTVRCAEQWASHNRYIAVGVSEVHGEKAMNCVIVQHPDQMRNRKS